MKNLLTLFFCLLLVPNGDYYREGVSKREYFAGLAMQGLLSNKYFQTYKKGWLVQDRIILDSLNLADALLTALNKQ